MSTVTREGNIIQVKRDEEKEKKKRVYMNVTYPHLQDMSSSLYRCFVTSMPPGPPTTRTPSLLRPQWLQHWRAELR